MTPCIHLHILASGSKGNAAVVEGPQGSVLIDCGLSRKRLMERATELNVDMDAVRYVLLTHEHSDHTSGLSVFANRFDGEMLATAGTVAARGYLSEMPFSIIGHNDRFEIAGMQVTAFPTSHDVADPVGFRFEVAGDALGYCTDTGHLTDPAMAALQGTRILALESNHDLHMLQTGPYPAVLKQRVSGDSGHLSNEQASAALGELADKNTECVIGMHLSQENNRPSIAVRTMAQQLDAQQANTTFTEARTSDGTLSVLVAGQDKPLTIW